MSSRDISLILATGGPQMVRACGGARGGAGRGGPEWRPGVAKAAGKLAGWQREGSGGQACSLAAAQPRPAPWPQTDEPLYTPPPPRASPQVRAAYSSGNPALGVGAGNTPAGEQQPACLLA